MRAVTLLIAAFFVATLVHAQPPTDYGWPCGHAKAAAARRMQELVGPQGPGDLRTLGGEDTDVLHYHLDIEIVPAARSISGSNTMTIASRVAGLSVFYFRLHTALTISELTLDGVPAAWSRLNDTTIEVTLNRPYALGEQFVLRVGYGGVPVSGTGYVYISSTLVFTISEPWFAYLWWPCKDDLGDKTTADLWFTVPSTMTIASNGLLQGVDDMGGGRSRYRWKTEYPTADYLYCIGGATYNTFETVWNWGSVTMPLKFFIFPASDTSANRNAWLKTVDMLTTFSNLYGVYPFSAEKYGIYQFSNVWFGGMEHQTMTGQMGFEESTTAHELSHQWWGDHVTCATWHDIWLNEGFATYSEALWYENKPGSPGAPALHSHMASRKPSNVDGTVYCYEITDPGRIFDYNLTYLKAGWVLHMLRHIIGDAAFFDFLHVYRAAFAGGAATTDQFQALLEDFLGRDMDWFFTPWVYRPGAPKYRYAWRQHVLDGRAYVELYVRQAQSITSPIFTMPVDIAVTGPGGTSTYVVWNDARQEHLLFEVAAPGVTNAVLDPTPWILWTERATVPFEEGPPKIVTMAPAPNAVVASAHLNTIEVVFHKHVAVDPPKLSLVGTYHGSPALTFAYDPQRYAVTLTPVAPLPSDTYTLTIADTITDVASGQKLDGELVDPYRPGPLPSGNGIAGGNAVARLIVTVAGDLNCDGVVSFGDINPFVLALSNWEIWKLTYPDCPEQNADIDGDGKYGGANGFGDINPFVRLLTGP
ncbi:MAG: M1 family aminopeptidase [Planctomycetota bacterium]